MTVLKNITYALLNVKYISHEQARQEGLELLAKVGLAEKADVYPSKLSGGQKQRVALAQAGASPPHPYREPQAPPSRDLWQ